MRAWVQRLRASIHAMMRQHLTPGSIGLAVGLGVFVGCLPIYGVHLLACVLLARWLKLNQALLYTAANISNPFFAPFLISGQLAIGEWLRYGHVTATADRTLQEDTLWGMLQEAPDLFVSCAVGSVVVGAVLGVVLGLGSLLAARMWPRRPAEAA